MKSRVLNVLRNAFVSVKSVRVKPTGIVLMRGLVCLMLIPIIIVIITYVLTFIQGYVDEAKNEIIKVGESIIDHAYVVPVLTVLVGLSGLTIDRDGDGIPDKLEENQSFNPLKDERSKDERNKP